MQDTLLMVFTGILAVAVVIQTAFFFGMYKTIRQASAFLDERGKDLLRNISIVSSKLDEGIVAIKSVAEGWKPIGEKLTETTDIIHNRVSDLDNLIAEITSTARVEILHVQELIQSASQKAEETLELMRAGLLAPFNEINAITRAIGVAIDVLFRRRRNPGSAQDEEMFI